MLTANIKVLSKKGSIDPSVVEAFVSYKDVRNITFRCSHLKHKPAMKLHVCLKKLFCFIDTYPECKGCKLFSKWGRDISKFSKEYLDEHN